MDTCSFGLDEQQMTVVKKLSERKNVILAAKAGSGKSFLIKKIKNFFKDKNVIITSTTGVSALAINGMTIHSFSGIGLGKKSKEELLNDIKKYANVKKRIISTDILVVDEVSMLSEELFVKLNFIFKKIRKNENETFGGMTLLFSGDFFQLEPVNGKNILQDKKITKDFIFMSLDTNYRQSEDLVFQNLLCNLRTGNLTPEDIALIKSRENLTVPENCIKMFCLNKDVAASNKKYSDSISGNEVVYSATFAGAKQSQLKSQFSNRGIEFLEFKPGMKVMLTRNMARDTGLVNGSCGKILKCFDDYVIVKFDKNQREEIIFKCNWELYENELLVASACQIPLIIANSVSIHKVQGLTLDCAYIDLSKSFCFHQIYVALSRVKTLSGIYIKGFDEKKVLVNEETKQFFQ